MWEKTTIGRNAIVTMGVSPSGETYSNSPSDYILVQGNADLINRVVKPRIWTTQKTKVANANDIILSVRAPAGVVGKTLQDVVIGRGVAAIQGDDFLYYYLQKYEYSGFWKHIASGSTFESINAKDIQDAILYVPSDNEKHKIEKTFKMIEQLIATFNNELIALKKYKEGLIHGLIERGTLLGKLGNLVVFEDKTKIKSEEGKSEGAYPFFTNNTDESTKYLDYFTFDGEYIILNTGGEAYVRYYNGKFATMSDCLVLKPKSRPISIYYFLKDFENIINSRGFQGTGLKHLDQDWLFNLKISVPTIEEDKLTKIESLFHKLSDIEESKLLMINQIKSNLLNNMFI